MNETKANMQHLLNLLASSLNIIYERAELLYTCVRDIKWKLSSSNYFLLYQNSSLLACL